MSPRALVLSGMSFDLRGISEYFAGTPFTPGLHNKIPAYKILARGWIAQEPICS